MMVDDVPFLDFCLEFVQLINPRDRRSENFAALWHDHGYVIHRSFTRPPILSYKGSGRLSFEALVATLNHAILLQRCLRLFAVNLASSKTCVHAHNDPGEAANARVVRERRCRVPDRLRLWQHGPRKMGRSLRQLGSRKASRSGSRWRCGSCESSCSRLLCSRWLRSRLIRCSSRLCRQPSCRLTCWRYRQPSCRRPRQPGCWRPRQLRCQLSSLPRRHLPSWWRREESCWCCCWRHGQRKWCLGGCCRRVDHVDRNLRCRAFPDNLHSCICCVCNGLVLDIDSHFHVSFQVVQLVTHFVHVVLELCRHLVFHLVEATPDLGSIFEVLLDRMMMLVGTGMLHVSRQVHGFLCRLRQRRRPGHQHTRRCWC
mmetsp:Transcript_32365/g.58792  ORF Transcript_32365/g.58792 Transcript_32365/m.58792 type:complete len:370 (+) Transcript_32365:589-1698(+)